MRVPMRWVVVGCLEGRMEYCEIIFARQSCVATGLLWGFGARLRGGPHRHVRRLTSQLLLLAHPVGYLTAVQILEELGGRIYSADHQSVTCPGARHIEQLPLGLIDIVE